MYITSLILSFTALLCVGGEIVRTEAKDSTVPTGSGMRSGSVPGRCMLDFGQMTKSATFLTDSDDELS